jgi:hypothetical protein
VILSEMNARQLIQGADRKKRPRPVVEYSSSESDPGIDNQVEIPQQDDDKVRFVVQKTTKGKIDLWHDGDFLKIKFNKFNGFRFSFSFEPQA